MWSLIPAILGLGSSIASAASKRSGGGAAAERPREPVRTPDMPLPDIFGPAPAAPQWSAPPPAAAELPEMSEDDRALRDYLLNVRSWYGG